MTLMEVVLQAHHNSALRGNCSHHAVVLAAMGSGDYFKAIAAGLMTLGGLHGPLLQTYDLLAGPSPEEVASLLLETGKRIPGWGNGFVKGEPDPLWSAVTRILDEEFPYLFEKIESVTEVAHRYGKMIYPNPSCFTAATALALDIPRSGVGEILVRGRLSAWTQEYSRITAEAPVIA